MAVINCGPWRNPGPLFDWQKNEDPNMGKNTPIAEFEAAVTTRVLLDRLVDHINRSVALERFTYQLALEQSCYSANDVLIALDLNRDLWVRLRGRRAYMFYEPGNRIVAELAVITESDEDRMHRRPKVGLFGRGGRALREKTLGDLSESGARLSRPQVRPAVIKRMEAIHAAN